MGYFTQSGTGTVRICRASKGPKNLGVRPGNWFTADRARALWQAPNRTAVKGKETGRFSAFSWVAGYAGKMQENWRLLISNAREHATPPTPLRGCLLLYVPGENVSDGASRFASNRFFDTYDCPP